LKIVLFLKYLKIAINVHNEKQFFIKKKSNLDSSYLICIIVSFRKKN